MRKLLLATAVLLAAQTASAAKWVNPRELGADAKTFEVVSPPDNPLKVFELGDIGYYDGNTFGDGFSSMHLELRRDGSNVTGTLSFNQSSNGWHSDGPPVTCKFVLLDRDGRELGQLEIDTNFERSGATRSLKLIGSVGGLGSNFDAIHSVKLGANEWRQLVEAN